MDGPAEADDFVDEEQRDARTDEEPGCVGTGNPCAAAQGIGDDRCADAKPQVRPQGPTFGALSLLSAGVVEPGGAIAAPQMSESVWNTFSGFGGPQISELGVNPQMSARTMAGLALLIDPAIAGPQMSGLATIASPQMSGAASSVGREVGGPQMAASASSVYECSNPTCTSRTLNPHHLKFKSRGGGDEDENMTTLCPDCHLFGVHVGRIKVSPPASNMRWVLGRNATLVVQGRELVASAPPVPISALAA